MLHYFSKQQVRANLRLFFPQALGYGERTCRLRTEDRANVSGYRWWRTHGSNSLLGADGNTYALASVPHDMMKMHGLFSGFTGYQHKPQQNDPKIRIIDSGTHDMRELHVKLIGVSGFIFTCILNLLLRPSDYNQPTRITNTGIGIFMGRIEVAVFGGIQACTNLDL